MTKTHSTATAKAVNAHCSRAPIATDPAERQLAAARVALDNALLAQAGAQIAVINTKTAKRCSLAAYKANRAIAALERLQIGLTGIDRKNANLGTLH